MNRLPAPLTPARNTPPVFLPPQIPPTRHPAPHTVAQSPFPTPGYQPDHTDGDDFTSPSQSWLQEHDLGFDFEQGFALGPSPSAFDTQPPVDDNAPEQPTPNRALPPVLKALHLISEKQKGQAHRQLKQCATVEQALVEMLAASNSGKRGNGPSPARVVSVLGLLARLPLKSPVRGTFACLCLVRMRVERSAKGAAKRYIDLANALPPQFPTDELGPYQQVLIECGRQAIQQIRDEDVEHFKQQPSEALDALTRIESRLMEYQAQPCSPPQVSIEALRRQVGVRYPLRGTHSASSLKRRHERIVAETTPADAVDEADEENMSPTGEQRPLPAGVGRHAMRPMPPSPGLTAPGPMRSWGIPPQPVATWGPARFAGELHAMVLRGSLIVRQPVAQALQVFATCLNRQGLTRALPSIHDAQGFLDMLNLMLGLNPPAAGELALHTALNYIERGLVMPDAVATAVVGALSQVSAWPQDVPFSLTLMNQVGLQPPLVREAVANLIDRLLHGPG